MMTYRLLSKKIERVVKRIELFVKKYLTSLIKRQWGQNLMKFTGIKMPGGVEFNGRQIYDDAQGEIEKIEGEMLSKYETAPLDFVG